MDKKVLEIYFDHSLKLGYQRGCWRVRLKDRPNVRTAGKKQQEALENFFFMAPSHKESDRKEDYKLVRTPSLDTLQGVVRR